MPKILVLRKLRQEDRYESEAVVCNIVNFSPGWVTVGDPILNHPPKDREGLLCSNTDVRDDQLTSIFLVTFCVFKASLLILELNPASKCWHYRCTPLTLAYTHDLNLSHCCQTGSSPLPQKIGQCKSLQKADPRLGGQHPAWAWAWQ